MLYYSRLCNSVLCIFCACLVVIQRDVDGELLVNGYHGLALVTFLLMISAFVNFKGALDHMFDCC